RPLEISAEYKYASGTRDPRDTTRGGTFDQLFPANHDKFGHEDLLGWRNLHNLRSLTTWEVAKGWSWNVMYNQFWLASACDALYSGSGGAIARSSSCAAGRHVG